MTPPVPTTGPSAPDALSAVRLLSRTGRLSTAPPDRPAATAAGAAGVRRPPFAWKARVLLPAALLAGFAGAVAYTARDALVPPRAVTVVPVVLAPAGGAAGGGGPPAGAVAVQAPGWLEADPFAVAVPALADGFVREVLVLEGQPVAKGQVVARLVDDDAKLLLAKAEAELALREAAAKAAQATWDNPVERTRAVAAAEGKAAQTRAELRMLEAEVLAMAAKAAEARYESERLDKAYEGQAATGVEAVVSRQRRAAAEATLEATARRDAVLGQQLAQAEAELTAARENQRLRIEEARALAEATAAADLARASRDEAKLRLARMEVRSPADGVVLSRHADPGSKLMLSMDHPLSSVVVKLYDPARLQVRVDVPLADAGKVSVGQDAQVTVAKLPDRVFRARVTRVVREADVQKNTQQFKVAILDPDPGLTPEMLARAKFLAAAPAVANSAGGGAASGGETAVFAPASLLRRQGEAAEATAWVVDPARKVATLRAVQLGSAARGGWVAVAGGLSAGDQLIAETAGLSEGMKVRVDGEATLPGDGGPPAAAAPVPAAGKEAGHGVH
jgi:HlyD family secretion protein